MIANIYQVPQSQVLITHGSQEALYLFYRTYLSPTDHVITFTPGWQQAWEVPREIGCEVTTIPLAYDNHYQIELNKVIEHIRPETKLISIISPNNPLGIKIPEEILNELADICDKRGIFLLNDEEYHKNYPKSLIHLPGKTGISSSLSKVYGFPGLRIGWFIADKPIIENMRNYKRYTTVSNASLCEFLAIEILKKYQHYIQCYEHKISANFQIFSDFISRYPELDLIKPDGTPFAYVQLPNSCSSMLLAEKLLKKHRVLIMPAEVFSGENAIRVSFVRSPSILNEGLDKLGQIINETL